VIPVRRGVGNVKNKTESLPSAPPLSFTRKGKEMSTERERKILETAAGACQILIECRTCGKLRTHGMMPCDCSPEKERCVDCLKLCRKILKELKPNAPADLPAVAGKGRRVRWA